MIFFSVMLCSFSHSLPYPNSVTNFLFYNTYIVVDNLVDPEELYQIVPKINDGLLQFNGNENTFLLSVL